METIDFDAYDLSVSLSMEAFVVPPDIDDEVEPWSARLLVRVDDDAVQVAKADFIVVPLGTARPGEALDALSAESAEFACMFVGEDLCESLDVEGLAGLVIVDRIHVEAAFRAKGLGPLLVAEAFDRLGRDCAMAACSDGPLATEVGSMNAMADRAAIRRMARDFGFEEWRDGLWILDLSTTVLQATRLAILEARLSPLD